MNHTMVIHRCIVLFSVGSVILFGCEHNGRIYAPETEEKEEKAVLFLRSSISDSLAGFGDTILVKLNVGNESDVNACEVQVRGDAGGACVFDVQAQGATTILHNTDSLWISYDRLDGGEVEDIVVTLGIPQTALPGSVFEFSFELSTSRVSDGICTTRNAVEIRDDPPQAFDAASFPSALGTRWHYAYRYHLTSRAFTFNEYIRFGNHVWEVVQSSWDADTLFLEIRTEVRDSIKIYQVAPVTGAIFDTSYSHEHQGLFVMAVHDSVVSFPWCEAIGGVPQRTTHHCDVESFFLRSSQVGMGPIVVFRKELGMLFLLDGMSGNTGWFETLTLVGMNE